LKKATTWVPRLESLEDRLTPALSYVLGGGSLFVLGSTANATVTVTSNAGGVTVADGASTSPTFAVTGSLNVFIQMSAANPVFNYDPGVAATGTVNLNVNSPSNVKLNVAGTSNVNINGTLFITTGAGDDSVNIDNVNPAGLVLNTGAGYDTVLVGYNAPVTVRGGITATNVNLFGLGNNNMAGPPVVVQGFVHVSTDIGSLINDVDIEPGVTIAGSLITHVNGVDATFAMAGAVGGDAITTLGAGPNRLAFIAQNGSVGGNVVFTAAKSSSSNVGVDGFVGGNVTVALGDGTNTFSFSAQMLGTSVTYIGGAGNDTVLVPFSGTNAPNTRLFALLGGGNNVFAIDGNGIASAFVLGSLGSTNTLTTFPEHPTTIPLSLIGF
jgi:hypothetical protein